LRKRHSFAAMKIPATFRRCSNGVLASAPCTGGVICINDCASGKSQSILLLHTLVFIIKTVIWATIGLTGQEVAHFILIQIYGTDIGFVILVVIVKYTAFTIVHISWVSENEIKYPKRKPKGD
jgi:hypothetical protein